jgi:hypothetical protein
MAYDNITTLPVWLSNGLFVRSYTNPTFAGMN